MSMTQRTLLCLVVLCACGAPAPDDGPGPLTDGWTRLDTGEMSLAPGEERFFCYFGTFAEDGGIRDARHWTNSDLLHADHILMRVAPDDVPFADGTIVDCEEAGDWWFQGAPLYEGFGLPDGVAYEVRAGQRFVVDSHYINVTDAPATVRTVVDLDLIDAADVAMPAAAFSFDAGGDLRVPPGGGSETFECAWHVDTTILAVGSHMHENGRAFQLDWLRDGVLVERIIDAPEWSDGGDKDREGRYVASSVTVRRGDVFRTSCTWANPRDRDLVFPDEMCTTWGTAYPLSGGAVCYGGGTSHEPGPPNGPPQ